MLIPFSMVFEPGILCQTISSLQAVSKNTHTNKQGVILPFELDAPSCFPYTSRAQHNKMGVVYN